MELLTDEERATVYADIRTRMGITENGWSTITNSVLFPEIIKHAKYGNWGFVALMVTAVEREQVK